MLDQGQAKKTTTWLTKAYQILIGAQNAISGDKSLASSSLPLSGTITHLRHRVLRSLAWAQHVAKDTKDAQRTVDLLLAEDQSALTRCLAMEIACATNPPPSIASCCTGEER